VVPGSVTVDPGQRVERGQQVGRCGYSGNSSEPHLHFQVQDHPDFATTTSLPVRFDDIEIESPGVTHEPDLVPGYDVWHSGSPDDSPDGYHSRTFVVEGQRVAHAERPGGEEDHEAEPRSVDADATDDPADDRASPGDISAGWLLLAGFLGYVAVGVCEGTRLHAVSPEPVAP
jgi:murein DD-endopeptidase MepM/ murein hydrolase activator NlpD